MKNLAWLAMLLLAAVFIVGSVGCGDDEATPAPTAPKVYTMKLSTSATAEQTYGTWAGKFEELVEARSDGQVQVEIFFSGAIASQTNEQPLTRAGTIQGYWDNEAILSTDAPKVGVLATPFIFENFDHAQRVMSGPIFDELAAEAEEVANVKVMLILAESFRNFSSATIPILTPEDMAGWKVRSLPSPIYVEIWEAMGASPMPMSWAEGFPALQQGVLDGADNPVIHIIPTGTQEIFKHVTLSDYSGAFSTLVLNLDFFNSLPDELQQVLVQATKDTKEFAIESLKTKDAEAIKACEEYGIEFHYLTTEQRDAFKSRLQGIYASQREKYGDLLDRIIEY